jgi:hypothetical protein
MPNDLANSGAAASPVVLAFSAHAVSVSVQVSRVESIGPNHRIAKPPIEYTVRRGEWASAMRNRLAVRSRLGVSSCILRIVFTISNGVCATGSGPEARSTEVALNVSGEGS